MRYQLYLQVGASAISAAALAYSKIISDLGADGNSYKCAPLPPAPNSCSPAAMQNQVHQEQGSHQKQQHFDTHLNQHNMSGQNLHSHALPSQHSTHNISVREHQSSNIHQMYPIPVHFTPSNHYMPAYDDLPQCPSESRVKITGCSSEASSC